MVNFHPESVAVFAGIHSKVFDQTISQRLGQLDHIQGRKKIKKDYPHHTIKVMLGIPELSRKTRKIINDVESILIYANWTVDMYNQKKIFKFQTSRMQLKILNNGNYKPLHKVCAKAIVVG